MKHTIIVLLLFVCAFNAYGQNYLLDSTRSGLHLAGQYGSSQGSTIGGGVLGYTFDGTYTLSLAAGKENNRDLKMTAFSLKPHMSFMILKQGVHKTPISAAFGLSFQRSWFQAGQKAKVESIVFDCGFFRKMRLSRTTSLIPGVLGGLVAWSSFTNQYMDKVNQTYLYGFQLSLLAGPFHLTPMLQYTTKENLRTFNVVAGFIFPRKQETVGSRL
ncbi:hypothetical protein GCM10027275_33290 [Rhabdobacter roseus]|uniref:Outer membrane protein beta-barrel domain-containing protein n=1 Tax=Rhabdobacter roseus TaxID=1655419 RepID=A0A840TZ28_9BACT|nr:hypothetical protein [Rhabdobacter roseus]MBB5285448.1 hypothetical protein [Rhabdobacter roseus]